MTQDTSMVIFPDWPAGRCHRESPQTTHSNGSNCRSKHNFIQGDLKDKTNFDDFRKNQKKGFTMNLHYPDLKKASQPLSVPGCAQV